MLLMPFLSSIGWCWHSPSKKLVVFEDLSSTLIDPFPYTVFVMRYLIWQSSGVFDCETPDSVWTITSFIQPTRRWADPKENEVRMDRSKFPGLLAKYGMTFYWGAIDKKWWIVGQVENGCNQNSIPASAESFNAAQIAALSYIQKKYKLD